MDSKVAGNATTAAAFEQWMAEGTAAIAYWIRTKRAEHDARKKEFSESIARQRDFRTAVQGKDWATAERVLAEERDEQLRRDRRVPR